MYLNGTHPIVFAPDCDLHSTMSFCLQEIHSTDFPELEHVMGKYYEDPPSSIYKLFCPPFGNAWTRVPLLSESTQSGSGTSTHKIRPATGRR